MDQQYPTVDQIIPYLPPHALDAVNLACALLRNRQLEEALRAIQPAPAAPSNGTVDAVSHEVAV